jgi:hypothetical protein
MRRSFVKEKLGVTLLSWQYSVILVSLQRGSLRSFAFASLTSKTSELREAARMFWRCFEGRSRTAMEVGEVVLGRCSCYGEKIRWWMMDCEGERAGMLEREQHLPVSVDVLGISLVKCEKPNKRKLSSPASQI